MGDGREGPQGAPRAEAQVQSLLEVRDVFELLLSDEGEVQFRVWKTCDYRAIGQ